MMPPADICPVKGERHAYVVPVKQVPPDSNYRGWAYVLPTTTVRGKDVFCRDCGRPAPTGYGDGKELG